MPGPAYLSFDLGPGFDRSDLNLWHHDASLWTDYAAALALPALARWKPKR